MNRMSKMLPVLGIIALLCCCVFACAEATGNECGDNLTWTMDNNGVLTISGTGDMDDFGALNTPWGRGVKKVIIQNGVTSIGNYAFYWCTGLTSVMIPDGVMSIGSYAFYDCSKLSSITIPSSLKSIGDYAFSNCSVLENITIPEGLTNIGGSAFAICSTLTSVTIPESMISIGSNAFQNCSNLTSITMSESAVSLGDWAFNTYSSSTAIYAKIGSDGAKSLKRTGSDNTGYSFQDTRYPNLFFAYTYDNDISSDLTVCSANKNLTEATIPKGVTRIGDSAFNNCKSLISVTIQDGVEYIEENAFSSCSNLTSIIIPDSLISIGREAFLSCSNLSSITIPDNVTSIGELAFYNSNPIFYARIGSKGAKALKLNSNSGYRFRDTRYPDLSFIYYYDENEVPNVLSVYGADPDLTEVIIPEDVTNIGYDAFKDYGNLTTVSIPDSVTSIENEAFYNCSSLMGITIPENVTSIGNYAFQDCRSLISFTFPESIESIGAFAFKNCSNLKSVTIPESVTSIGTWAFDTSTAIYAIIGSDGAKALRISELSGGYSFIDTRYPMLSFTYTYDNNGQPVGLSVNAANLNLTEAIIPEDVTSIEWSAFKNCNALTSVTIPEGVTSIGQSAFEGCANLAEITIPASVTSIGKRAFRSSGLKKIAFLVRNSQSISIGNDIFSTPYPSIYCYQYTTPYTAFKDQYTIVLMDNNMDGIWTVSLPTDYRMANGTSVMLKAQIFPNDGEPIEWSSSAPSVVSVDDGVITAHTSGTATITASLNSSISASITVEVYTPAATGFTLSTEEAWLETGDSFSLFITAYEPENAEAVISWSSSDMSLATVDDAGTVSAISTGDVTITASTEQEISRSCLIHICGSVTAVSVNPAAAILLPGGTLALESTAETQNGTYINKLVSFESDSPLVAEVNSQGMVTGISHGMATITVSSFSGKIASVRIAVQDESVGMHLPADLKVIEAQAFANIRNTVFYLPAGITDISDSAFNSSVIIVCSVPSYAETRCRELGLPVIDLSSVSP